MGFVPGNGVAFHTSHEPGRHAKLPREPLERRPLRTIPHDNHRPPQPRPESQYPVHALEGPQAGDGEEALSTGNRGHPIDRRREAHIRYTEDPPQKVRYGKVHCVLPHCIQPGHHRRSREVRPVVGDSYRYPEASCRPEEPDREGPGGAQDPIPGIEPRQHRHGSPDMLPPPPGTSLHPYDPEGRRRHGPRMHQDVLPSLVECGRDEERPGRHAAIVGREVGCDKVPGHRETARRQAAITSSTPMSRRQRWSPTGHSCPPNRAQGRQERGRSMASP